MGMPPRLTRQPPCEGLQVFDVAEAAGVERRGEDRENVRRVDVELSGEEGGRQSWRGVAVRRKEGTLFWSVFSPSLLRSHDGMEKREHGPGEERSAERDFVVVIVVHLADVEQGRTLAVVNRQNLRRACGTAPDVRNPISGAGSSSPPKRGLTVFASFYDVPGCSFREQGGEQVVVGAVAVEQGCERDRGRCEVVGGRQEQVAREEDKVGLRARSGARVCGLVAS